MPTTPRWWHASAHDVSKVLLLKLKSFCTLTGRGTPSRSHVKQNIVTPYAVSFDRPQCLIKFASNNPLTARTCASKSASAPVDVRAASYLPSFQLAQPKASPPMRDGKWSMYRSI